jgi:hypothetical protein
MASVLPTIEEGTWFLWNPFGNIYKSAFLWWQVLLLGICSKISKLGLDLLFDLHIQLQILPLGVNNDNISLYNKRNNLINVPSKKEYLATTSNNIFPIITKDNNILELQGLLEHNNFTSIEFVTKIKQMLIYVSNKHNWITKKKKRRQVVCKR